MKRHAKAIAAVSAMLLVIALGATIASAVAPTVTVEDASNVSYTTADVKGEIDPADHETSYHFEYATEADFSSAESQGFGSVPVGASQAEKEASATLTGLKPGTTYHLRLVAENTEGERSEAVAASTFTTEAVAAPTVSIDPVTAVTGDSAHFSGHINPNAPGSNPEAFNVNWRFECTPACPGLQGNRTIDADGLDHAVSVDATGLLPNTDYEVTLIVSNASGQLIFGPKSFKTDAVGPAAISLPVGPLTETTAIIGGQVDPNGSATTYYVQYASREDFSDAVSLPALQNANAGSGQIPVAASQLATGLQPDTDYFFRIVAESSAGTDTSEAERFHTLAPEPATSCSNEPFRTGPSSLLSDCRAYEKVTPSDKNDGDAFQGAVLDGNHVYFVASSSFFDTDPWLSNVAYYLGARSSDGWSLRPGWQAPSTTAIVDFNASFSQDVISGAGQLLPADSDDGFDVYVRNSNGLNLASIGALGGNSGEAATYVAESPDGNHVLFETKEHLEAPDTEANRIQEAHQLYEYSAGQLRVVGVNDANQLTSDGGGVLGNGASTAGSPAGSSNAISDGSDGHSRVFFESPDPGLGGDHQLYARVDASDTLHVSASQCTRVVPACDDSGHGATFQGASNDGSVVFFTTIAQLTNDDLDSSPDLYRYDFEAEQLTRLTEFQDPNNCVNSGSASTICGVEGVSAISDDGKRVYYVAQGKTAQGGSSSASSIYLYDAHLDTTLFVASGDGADNLISSGLTVALGGASIAHSGAAFVFESDAQLTSFDNSNPNACPLDFQGVGNPCLEVYRYSVATKSIICVSCNTKGAPPLGVSLISRARATTSTPFSNPVSGSLGSRASEVVGDDGSIIVFESADALVPRDTNELFDVYQWHDGKVSLLSSGTDSNDSRLSGVSADGHDAFLTTYSQLVSSDVDFQADLYDARINGGLGGSARGGVPCAGEACKGKYSPGLEAPSPGSAMFAGPGNLKVEKRHKKQHHKKRHRKSRGKRNATPNMAKRG